ncbi:baculoviral IAP repeat-containing protein 7-B-like [Schistocerca piceifrons]|uniref:baculoviral IAP repeat-containing protein 7-B-like n=1 Tax=Schistocerca piceifrons TaxID=274613 RepID=UPI001F5E6705|nr:baculoviral IAP repeat-containing protein 7-B-like [Schistocerca piceifrons]
MVRRATGNGDATVCFHHGGGLKRCPLQDDPWTVHALWFSKSTFLIRVKGTDFLNTICHTKKSIIIANDMLNIKLEADILNKAGSSDGHVVEGTRLCKICFQDEVGAMFHPRGHISVYVKCALSISPCFPCLETIASAVGVFSQCN